MSDGIVAFITGLPASGKSTFAERALAALRTRGIAACLLDGDAVRACLVPSVGFSPPERAAFYETLGNLAALFAREGLVVLVAATANRREFREHAERVAPAFIEVFIATPLEECAQRDPKGLYAAARSGAARDVPGASEPFEEPEHPDIVASGGHDDEAVERLVTQLLRMGADAAPISRDLSAG